MPEFLGGSRGIGLAVVKKLLECRIIVVMAVRNPEECQGIVEQTIERPLWKERVFYEKCDIGDMTSVREFARKIQSKFDSINLLINNGKTKFEV